MIFSPSVPADVQYAATHGPVPVVVVRGPFPDEAVIAAMQRRNPGPPITFANTASASAANGYCILIAFGAPPIEGCSGAAQGERRASAGTEAVGRTNVSAAFCNGGRVISEASASTPRIGAAEDPRFARLMQDLLSALMPYNDPSQSMGGGTGGMM